MLIWKDTILAAWYLSGQDIILQCEKSRVGTLRPLCLAVATSSVCRTLGDTEQR